MAAPDFPADIHAISHLLSSDHSEVVARPSSSDSSLSSYSISIPSTEIAATSIIPALSTEFTTTPRRPSSLDSHETTVIQWRERVAAHPPSSDPLLLPSSTSIPSIKIAAISIIHALSTKYTATPHVLSTTPVHATSTHVISTTPSKTSLVRLSLKRRRLVFYYKASVEDGMEADAKADSESDGKIGSKAGVGIDVKDEAYTEDYDTNIKTDIVVDAEAHAQIVIKAAIKAEAEESDGDTIKIGVDVVHPEPVTIVVFPMSTIVVRLVEHAMDEREARARIKRQLGLVQEELESL
ncbi:hypothetical protein Tco_1296046, partial [Tanacetum coccineum]